MLVGVNLADGAEAGHVNRASLDADAAFATHEVPHAGASPNTAQTLRVSR